MSLREYNAFLVNNKERLVEVFSNISQSEIGEIKETEVLHKTWGIPPYQYYRHHKKLPVTKVLAKNVFASYGDNILIEPNRTRSEIEFENWCEDSAIIQHVYKNGDKGDDFFCIVYRQAFRRSHFYPDYIVQTKSGKIWIIEAKGGVTADGTSKNIDRYAQRKFEALKEYCLRYSELKWGFVRAVGSQLYISNTEWTENMFNHDIWKPIDEIII